MAYTLYIKGIFFGVGEMKYLNGVLSNMKKETELFKFKDSDVKFVNRGAKA